VRGIVIRFAKYELHERLEKKLFECARLDLMSANLLKKNISSMPFGRVLRPAANPMNY
jgi:hypothetical protein